MEFRAEKGVPLGFRVEAHFREILGLRLRLSVSMATLAGDMPTGLLCSLTGPCFESRKLDAIHFFRKTYEPKNSLSPH